MPPIDPITTTQLVFIAGAGGFVLDMMNLWEDSKKLKSDRTQKNRPSGYSSFSGRSRALAWLGYTLWMGPRYALF